MCIIKLKKNIYLSRDNEYDFIAIEYITTCRTQLYANINNNYIYVI